MSATDEAGLWRCRAEEGWSAMAAHSLMGRGSWLVAREPGGSWPVALWPFSRLLWAASVLSASGADPETNLQQATAVGQAGTAAGTKVIARSGSTVRGQPADPEGLWRALRWYRSRGALVDNRPRGRRYYDDNAWLALVAAQQALLTGRYRWWQRALAFVPFLERGCAADGGVLWVEGGDSRNACSTGSAGLLFAVLASGEAPVPGSTRARLGERAEAAADFLHTRLLRDDGLIADHLDATGRVEPSVWSYNQGLALSLFARIGRKDWADNVVEAMERGMPRAVLEAQPAAFNAIWFRSLMAYRPQHRPAAAADYLERAWSVGRDQRGLFAAVARYDEGVLIDHAAITGLMAAYTASERVRAALL